MSTSTTVAVLGLGSMGHAFAANVLKKGFPTRVWNRTRSKADDLGRDGAFVAASPAEAAQEAQVVIVMMPNADSTQEVLFGEHGALAGMPSGAVLAQMGTIGVEQTLQLQDKVKAQRPDVVFIDAPVSGTKGPAEQAQVLVLASGDRQAAAAVEPVFAAIGKNALWLGEAGAGAKMKLVVNTWLAFMTHGVAESARLAQALGFSIDDLLGALQGGPLDAPYAKIKFHSIEKNDFQAQFALGLALKDVRLALAAAPQQPLPLLGRIEELWSKASEAGGSKEDISVIYRYLGGPNAK